MKKFIFLLIVSVMASGCATFQKDQSMVTQLQLRVGELERKTQGKDQRIAELEHEVKDLAYDLNQLKKNNTKVHAAPVYIQGPSGKKVSGQNDERIIRVDVDAKTVQQALKNAGYYSAAIDGKIGSGTKRAIYQFQKDNGLKADGLIGRQTWTELKVFVQ